MKKLNLIGLLSFQLIIARAYIAESITYTVNSFQQIMNDKIYRRRLSHSKEELRSGEREIR